MPTSKTGDQEPLQVEVCIEIPRGSFIKRGSSGELDFVSPFPCPFNYGSIPASWVEMGTCWMPWSWDRGCHAVRGENCGARCNRLHGP